MSVISLNSNWKIRAVNGTKIINADIPFDAMQLDPRAQGAETGKNESWIIPNDYEYTKEFDLEDFENGSKIYIDFEGVYRDGEAFINEQPITLLPYGWSETIVDITELVKRGKNTVRVIAHNANQPNSRWYTGTGLIRPVNLIVLPPDHIVLNSIKITTLDYQKRLVNIKLETNNVGCLNIQVKKGDEVLYTFFYNIEYGFDGNLELPDLDLWDSENPALYDFKFGFKNHVESVRFGIRTIEYTENGLLLNGEHVVLHGTCLHSDAQTLGAVCSPFIERRKIKLLQNIGYNAIRSAHNPICKYMLDACDELGMLIMDEYVDCWYMQKTLFDYTKILADHWKDDLTSMLTKDYNHPSVVLYSLGNEVGETAQDKGVELLQEFLAHAKSIDNTRPYTCGVNIVFNGMVRMGIGFYDEKKALKEKENNKKKKQKVGSELFNDLSNYLGGRTLKYFATLPVCTKAIEKPFEILDVAGYNYGIRRYKKDLKNYPNRLILGSETFHYDMFEFVKLNKENPRIIGDFTWAGMDYLGEVAVGSSVDCEHCDNIMNGGYGWMSAGSGSIDLIGTELAEAKLEKVAHGLEVCELVTYSPKHYKLKHTVSSWKFSKCMPYYTYDGYTNHTMPVEFYTLAPYFELIQNDRTIAEGRTNKTGINKLKIKYKPGYLKLVVYDEVHRKLGEKILRTANQDELKISIECENEEIRSDELVYAHLKLTDNDGIIKPLQERRIHIEVEDGELLSLASGNPYNKEGFKVDTCKTYFGQALAIIRPTSKNPVKIKASCTDLSAEASVNVIY